MQTWGQPANSTQKGTDQESSQDHLACDSANQCTLATSMMHQNLVWHIQELSVISLNTL